MDELCVSSEFFLAFGIVSFPPEAGFVFRASYFGFKSLRQRSCPFPGGFLRPSAQREERSLLIHPKTWHLPGSAWISLPCRKLHTPSSRILFRREKKQAIFILTFELFLL
jgi:hypothetical protein